MKFLLTTLTFIYGGFIFSQIPAYVPINGLVGWWPFNGNANDESGNGYNGQIINTNNGISIVSDRFGINSAAIHYNNQGVTNPASAPYVELNNTNGISFTEEYSFNLWTSFEGSQVAELINKGSDDNSFFSRFQGVSSISFGNLTNYLTLGIAIDVQNWHMLTFIRNSTGTGKLYIDGQLIGSQVISSFINNMNNFYLGKMPSGGTNGSYYPFFGTLDDIGIWNRALTDQEIMTLFQGCQLGLTTQPQNVNVTTSSGVANFSVVASSQQVSYQWQTNLGLGFQNINNAGQYLGANLSNLSVSNLTLSNNNQVFRCIVTDGTCSDTSNSAILTIIDDAGLENIGGPEIHLQPNPNNGEFTLLIPNDWEGQIINLVSLDGKIHHTFKAMDSMQEIHMNHLASGSYWLRVGTNNPIPFIKN